MLGFALGCCAAAVPFVLTVSGLRRQLDVAERGMDYNADLLEQCKRRVERDSLWTKLAPGIKLLQLTLPDTTYYVRLDGHGIVEH